MTVSSGIVGSGEISDGGVVVGIDVKMDAAVGTEAGRGTALLATVIGIAIGIGANIAGEGRRVMRVVATGTNPTCTSGRQGEAKVPVVRIAH